MNRLTLRADVLESMDATGSGRWDTTPGGSVDRRIASVFDSLWKDILNANPYYAYGARTPVSDANGRYLLTDLNFSADDTLQRFYRILGVAIDGFIYDGPVQPTEWQGQTLLGSGVNSRVWYQEGVALVALPIQAAKVPDAIWVNYIPQRPDQLQDDNSTVTFPDGYEEVLIGLSAARLLTKAGAETQAAMEIKAEVAPLYSKMLADVSRLSTKPLAIQYNDTASEWGV